MSLVIILNRYIYILMLIYVYLNIKMKKHLNYSKEGPNYILFGKIFKIIGFQENKDNNSFKKELKMLI